MASENGISICFRRTISYESVRRLSDTILQTNVDSPMVSLWLDTPGGSLSAALALSRFLRDANIKLTTYNVGNVNSAGVALFVAGRKRMMTCRSRFKLHEVMTNISGYISLPTLEKILARLKADKEKLVKFLHETTGTDALMWHNLISREDELDAERAKSLNLVTDIIERVPDLSEMVEI